MTFDVFAAEDIKAADGVSKDYYKADEKVGTITTDSNGIAQMDNLPAGKYYVKEVKTAHGYVLDGEPRYVDLSYRDQDTPVITYDEKWQNTRQKVKVTVLKKEKDTDRVLAGGVFGLYTSEDIKNVNGDVLLEKDSLIEQKATDEKGQITFAADLPVDGKYYVKENSAPDGFVTTEEVQEFTFEYAGEDQAEVSYDFTFENQPTTVELTKTDLTTGKELPGAHLKVTDADGNVVDEWTSTEESHVIKELVVGNEYTMTETKPADGYVTAESITFTVENTAEIQKHEMKDDVTKVQISKTDITGDTEIPGAKLTILDKDDQVVESWTSTEEAHYIEKLSIGRYTLREEQAPKGYLLTSDVTFEVKDTGEIQKVVMKDDTAKGKVILNKTDKSSGEPLKGVEFEFRDSKGKVLEVIQLMVNILFYDDNDILSGNNVAKTIYDPACGTGGMLSVAEEYLHSLNASTELVSFGQKINDQTFAICKADMLIKGNNADYIKDGNTLSDDQFAGSTFDYILSNPPFGREWKNEKAKVEEEAKLGFGGRFGAGLPAASDGQMLFLMTAISKMKDIDKGGSRIAIIHNGSPLFTGDAGSGPSEIRRYILENDLLEAIIALPNDIFYNTGIATYIWVLSNKKAGTVREGKVQLINANDMFVKRRKALGNKRNDISKEDIAEITKIYGDFKESEISQIYDDEDFGYTKITVERPLRDEEGNLVLKKGKKQPDTSLRDTENVPLKEDIKEYFEREVLPFAPDAWVDEKKSKVGYEIPFTRYFYKYEAPRPSAEIMAEIMDLETELSGSLEEVFDL